MKNILLLSIFFISFFCFSQYDTIYSNNKKLIGTVKEVSEETIKFIYQDEELLNTIHKNTIQKIVFKNGREEIFVNNSFLKEVDFLVDYNKIHITLSEKDTQGLYFLGEVNAKAEGFSEFSNDEKIKKKAYQRFKQNAAMLGANLIFLTERIKKNSYAYDEIPFTRLSGFAYSDKIPNYDLFIEKINDRTGFKATTKYSLSFKDNIINTYSYKKKIEIYEIQNDKGFIYIIGKIKGVKNDLFRVVRFDDESFILHYETKNNVYNVEFNF